MMLGNFGVTEENWREALDGSVHRAMSVARSRHLPRTLSEHAGISAR